MKPTRKKKSNWLWDNSLWPIWHRHWLAVWSWRDWTTATRYSTARQSATSRSCSGCRTMQPESSSRHRGGPMPNRWCVNYTGCRFNTELTTRCVVWNGKWLIDWVTIFCPLVDHNHYTMKCVLLSRSVFQQINVVYSKPPLFTKSGRQKPLVSFISRRTPHHTLLKIETNSL